MTVSSCSIRTSTMPPKQSQHTMPAKEQQVFRFTDLPREMQEQVAGWLDLPALKNLSTLSKRTRRDMVRPAS